MAKRDNLVRILDLARWAPSGDNTQPWRFEIVSDDQIAVHGFDTRDHVVYDFDGHASHLAHGALLETIRMAATSFKLRSEWAVRSGSPETKPIYDVTFRVDPSIRPDPRVPFIEKRVVQRRPMRLSPLADVERAALVASVGATFRLQFFESVADRLRIAGLLWDSAYLRLTCPEAYQVHREVIEWGARYSAELIPERAVGVDPITGRLMHWVMESWPRVEFFNRYLLGTVIPRVQLDWLPALGCAGHILMRPRGPQVLPQDYVQAGMAMQRLWLTATSLGLSLQPEMTPVIFRWYVQAGRSISSRPSIDAGARRLVDHFDIQTAAARTDPFSFFCRIGHSSEPKSRSIRRTLADLMVKSVAGAEGD